MTQPILFLPPLRRVCNKRRDWRGIDKFISCGEGSWTIEYIHMGEGLYACFFRKGNSRCQKESWRRGYVITWEGGEGEEVGRWLKYMRVDLVYFHQRLKNIFKIEDSFKFNVSPARGKEIRQKLILFCNFCLKTLILFFHFSLSSALGTRHFGANFLYRNL